MQGLRSSWAAAAEAAVLRTMLPRPHAAGGAGTVLAAALANSCISPGGALGQISVRWATKKAGGSSKNNNSRQQPKMLGVKKFGGEYVRPGNIIIRQRGTKFRVGDNVGLGRGLLNHTVWALIEGHVKFAWDNFRKQNIVSVVPPLKYGDICTHKALEARAHNRLDRAMGLLGQAKFAYGRAGEAGLERTQALDQAVQKVLSKAEKSTKLRLVGPVPKVE